MTKIDSLGRRYRDRRNPIGIQVGLTDRDLLWFEKIHRHGPLSSTYLLEYSQSTHKSTARAKDRLTNLYHEVGVHGGPYLDRPWQQFATFDARYQDLIYDVTQSAEQALREAGRFYASASNSAGSWVHRYMVASITASIELTTLRTPNVRYIFQDEILGRAQTTMRFPVSVDGASKALIPDVLFGLEYRTTGKRLFRFFVVEADRSTEPVRSSAKDRKSYERTIRQYREFVGKGLYREALKLTAGLVVLNVTTSEARLTNLIDVVRARSENGSNSYMLFKALPQFGRIFKPTPVLHDLFTDPWQRSGMDSFFINE